MVSVPNTGLPQVAPGAPNGQAFAINVFSSDLTSLNLFRFAVAPGSATGGNFVYANGPTSLDVVPFAPYVEGQTYHVEYHADFLTDTQGIAVDGVQVVSNAPLQNPGEGVTEVFIFQNGVAAVPNVVALDNIVSSVPEPSSWIMLTLGATALLGILRRRNLAG